MDEAQESYRDRKEYECYLKYANNSGDNFCNAYWDNIFCWAPSPPGKVAQACPKFSEDFEIIGKINNPDVYALRICESDGHWLNNTTDYSLCLKDGGFFPTSMIYYVVAYILIVGSLLSLITLSISLFIFFYFKSLHCSRLKVHRNLCVALMLYLITMMILTTVSFFGFKEFWEKNWLCKPFIMLYLYSMMASTKWMFLEGLLLHSRVTVNIFKQDAPFKLYYCVGWGFPALMVAIWATLMSYSNEQDCWNEFETSPAIWLVTGPMGIALLTNTLFLVNIIRVLVTRHRNNVTGETMQVKRAIKATALLFPLLGITHLLFCINPNDHSVTHYAYIVFNSFIKSSQGLFVGILYCFMNTDVQTAVKNAFSRMAIQYNPNQHGRSKVGRGLSQTSNTYTSHSELDATKKLSTRATLVLQDTRQQTKKIDTKLTNDNFRSSMV